EVGAIIGCINVAHDITARKKSEDELQKFKMAIEKTPNSIIITNAHHVIEYVNPAFIEQTGYESHEVIGHAVHDFRPSEEDMQGFINRLVMDSSQLYEGASLSRKKNGEMFCEIQSVTPLRDADGLITHYVRVAIDITDQIKAEQRLKRAYDDLER